ncbi:hypothetical protein MBLNU459_g2579t1 [Dothideomycetes sp. NU459]
MASDRRPSTPPLHRKYLRAVHDYQPEQSTLSASTGGVSVTVPLTQGDVVLVHLTHANGWADGTILQTGARGWIPTNYCEVYDHPFIRSLLHGLTHLWDYLSSGGVGKIMTDERQDYVQGLIAGIRRLLEHCNCLHRDDALIQMHIGLRRTRKSLLADLAALMKCRNEIQDTFSDAIPADVTWDIIDGYMSKAFKTACRAVRFLDLWIQGTSPRRLRLTSRSFEYYGDASRPSTSMTTFSLSSPTRLQIIETEHAQAVVEDSVKDSRETSDEADCHAVTRPKSAEAENLLLDEESLVHLAPQSRPTSSGSLRQPSAYRRSSPVLGYRPDNASVSDVALEDCRFASDRLVAAHDNFLGHVGSFIGLHLQSRTSLDLAAATKSSVEACAGLVAVVNAVWEKDPQRSEDLSWAMVMLRQDLEQLTAATKEICARPCATADATTVQPEEGKALVGAATACVRSAGDCAAKARELLDFNGDIELDAVVAVNSSPHAADAGAGANAGIVPKVQVTSDKPTNPSNSQTAVDGAINWQHECAHVEVPAAAMIPLRLRTATDEAERLKLFSFTSNGGGRPSSSASPLNKLPFSTSLPPQSPNAASSPNSAEGELKNLWNHPVRKESLGLSATESMSTYQNSLRNSTGSALSSTSTRATTPDRLTSALHLDTSVLNSFGSTTSMQSAVTAATDDFSDGEGDILTKSYAHELLFNKDGLILGGTLPALVEKLTSQDSAPDPTYVTTFYLTFRLFTTATELANALISRFEYVGDNEDEDTPARVRVARLRVYNFFKGWLESHWNSETDSEALELIHAFACDKLQPQLASAGQRLVELADKAAHQSIYNNATQLVSPVGKTSVSLGPQHEKESIPVSIISKQQLALLHNAQAGTTSCSIADLDALEIARQFTLMESHVFCAIEPQELLNLEWTKVGSSAYNVRSMARFSTDLANLVADSIVSTGDVKRRAAIVKQWIKIGKSCQDLRNYDSVMAIICSLSSSTILRLRQTWELVPPKWKAQFEEMKTVVDVSRNYAVLRKLIESSKAPCLPFVGIYLTDLTFVDAGNQSTRTLPSTDDTVEPITVVNFDKHMRTTRIISQLQRYQVPYRLHPVPQIQDWIQLQISRVRRSDDCCPQTFWKRSLKVEPKMVETDADSAKSGIHGMGDRFKPKHKASKSGLNGGAVKDRFDFLGSLGFKTDTEMRAKLASAS